MFDRKKKNGAGALPSDTVDRMARFGRFEFSPMDSTMDGSKVWTELQQPYLSFAQTEPERFVEQLAATVLPAGGWACYGAHKTVGSLISVEFRSPAYDQILATALEFLRSKGVTSDHLNFYEMNFWRENYTDAW